MQQFFNGVPQYVWDDGVTFNFQITGFGPALGFFHRPLNVSAFATEQGAATPPVKWTEYDNLDSWVEMIKYSYRHKTPISVFHDDTVYVNYNSWSAVANPPGGGGEGYGGGWSVYWVYSVAL